MCGEENIQETIIHARPENLEKVWKWYGESKEVFEKMCKNSHIAWMLMRARPENLDTVLSWSGESSGNFEEICSHGDIRNILTRDEFINIHLSGMTRESFEKIMTLTYVDGGL